MSRVTDLVAAIGQARPEFNFRLNPPATEEQLVAAEAEYGHRFPDDVRELYLLADGQPAGEGVARLFIDHYFSPLAQGLSSWRMMVEQFPIPNEMEHLPNDMLARKKMRPVDVSHGWFPLAYGDKYSVAVDMEPSAEGTVGQIVDIDFWGEGIVLAGSLTDLLERVLELVTLSEEPVGPLSDPYAFAGYTLVDGAWVEPGTDSSPEL